MAEPTPAGGVWRVLILDASPDDPMWLICSVTLSSDIRPALMDGRRYRDWDQVVGWVRTQVSADVSLTPIAAAGWRIDEGEPRT